MMQTASFSILAAISAEDVASPIVGFIVVMAALSAIWVLLEIQGAFFRRLDRKTGAETEAMPEMEMAVQGDLHGGLSPELVAILTAAVHAAVNAPVRIVSIRSGRDSSWSEEGRRSIYSSHRLR